MEERNKEEAEKLDKEILKELAKQKEKEEREEKLYREYVAKTNKKDRLPKATFLATMEDKFEQKISSTAPVTNN